MHAVRQRLAIPAITFPKKVGFRQTAARKTIAALILNNIACRADLSQWEMR